MSCQDAQALLHGYVDGELDLVRSLEIERHLHDCSACTREYHNHLLLTSVISNGSLYFKTPAHLRKRVRSAVRDASKEEQGPGLWSWQWLRAGVSLALGAIILWTVVSMRLSPSADDRLAQEIVSGHVRSLMANHLTDVPSSDQHTVKPWFDGKLDFSPPVTDFTKEGFALVGGRLDYLSSRPVAALVYQRRQHFINLFIYPFTGDTNSSEKMMIQQGYNLIRWTKAGMSYWVISDLNLNELQEFAQVVHGAS